MWGVYAKNLNEAGGVYAKFISNGKQGEYKKVALQALMADFGKNEVRFSVFLGRKVIFFYTQTKKHKNMRYATKAQVQKIHVLLNSTGMIDAKREIVRNLTQDRTDSTRQLYLEEATALIRRLAVYDPREVQVSAIFSLAYKAGIIYGDTPADKKMNAAKLNLFIRERGAVKKALAKMTLAELVKVHRQFEAIARATKVSRNKKEANKAVSGLLGELNIGTSR